MYQIPLINIPSQRLSVVLNYQDVTLSVYTKQDNLFGSHLYLDLTKDGKILIEGQIVVVNQKLIPDNIGFTGNLYMIDLDANDEPQYQDLGNRFILIYAEDSELQ